MKPLVPDPDAFLAVIAENRARHLSEFIREAITTSASPVERLLDRALAEARSAGEVAVAAADIGPRERSRRT